MASAISSVVQHVTTMISVLRGGVVLVGLMAVLYSGACLFLLTQQRQMIFVPTRTLDATPDDLGLAYDDVWLRVAPDKSDRIHGWWIPSSEPVGVMLYLHGNGENISANLSYAQQFHRLGFSILMIDYRGYGLSDGRFPSEAQAYEDAQAAWNYLVHDRGIPPKEILLFGHSLGGAIALDLAIRQPDATGLIIESAFTSIRDMALRTPQYRIFPIDALLTQRFDSLSKVRSLQMPILIIHGTADTVVPADMSDRLYAAAPYPKELLMVTGAAHNNVAEIGGEQYLQTIKQFMKQVGMAATQ